MSAGPSSEQAMVGTGFGAIVAGGLVAAVTGPLDLGHGSWAAAYLVLVLGVAQAVMGHDRRQRSAADRPVSLGLGRSGWTQWSCWNLGGAAILLGAVVGRTWLVDLGSAALLVSLVVALAGTRRPAAIRHPWARLWTHAYRAVLAVLVVSVPIGIVLSHVRHS